MVCLIATVAVLLAYGIVSPASGANILGLMGVPSPSHHIWNSVLMYRLAEEGHNVTVLSVDLPKPGEKLPPNLHYIYLEEGYALFAGEQKVDLSKLIGMGSFEMVPSVYDYSFGCCYSALKSKGMNVLLNYPDDFKFDLIIYDYAIHSCLVGFIHKFKYPPVVGVSAFHIPPSTIDAMSNHNFPAYVPHYATEYVPEMNFLQRMKNTVLFIFDTVYRRWVFLPKTNEVMKTYFPKDTPNIRELMLHTTIALVNSHPAVNYVESLPPNVIEVGGLQLLDPKPLPKDLDDFMNKSKNGVILVSFGTNMRSEFFTDNQIDVILSAMSQLPQYDFLWKFDVKYLGQRKLPANLLIKPFLPQRDLLAHPKIKAFVTHCGGLSTQETIWRGVPMVGVPLFGDQPRNFRLAERAGVAKRVDFLTMTTDDLRDTIVAVAEDPTIRANSNLKAVQFQDTPMKPLDTAVWWVEYLLRNPNPSHLKSASENLNVIQANSLDCLFVLWCSCAISIHIIVKLLSLACKGFKSAKKPSKSTKQKKMN